MANATAFHKIDQQIYKDPAVAGVTVELDTSRWSTRKRNIIVTALTDGLAVCGRRTSWLVRALLLSVGETSRTGHYCSDFISLDAIKDEKREELLAYTCAWMKLEELERQRKHAANPYSYKYKYSRYHGYLNSINADPAGRSLTNLPCNPTMTHRERHEFYKEYVKPVSYSEALGDLIRQIKAGDTITINANS